MFQAMELPCDHIPPASNAIAFPLSTLRGREEMNHDSCEFNVKSPYTFPGRNSPSNFYKYKKLSHSAYSQQGHFQGHKSSKMRYINFVIITGLTFQILSFTWCVRPHHMHTLRLPLLPYFFTCRWPRLQQAAADAPRGGLRPINKTNPYYAVKDSMRLCAASVSMRSNCVEMVDSKPWKFDFWWAKKVVRDGDSRRVGVGIIVLERVYKGT